MAHSERKSPGFVGRSDHLPDIRRFLAFRKDLAQLIPAIATYPVVIDANILISDLLWLSKRATADDKPALLECLIAKTLVAYVTSTVVVEVERNMERLAAKRRIPSDVWRSHWSEYKALLCIEDPDPWTIARYANGRDPADAPTLALAEIRAVCGILSEDKDIKAMGGSVIPITFKLEARDYSRKAVVFVSLQIGGCYVAVGAVEAILFAARALGRGFDGFRALPDGVKMLALLAVAAALLHPTSRKVIVDGLWKMGAAVSEAFPKVMEFLSQVAQFVEDNRAIPPVVTHL